MRVLGWLRVHYQQEGAARGGEDERERTLLPSHAVYSVQYSQASTFSRFYTSYSFPNLLAQFSVRF